MLGHESLGRVAEAPDGCGLSRDDLVVGIVRRPDPVPCPNCAVGEWDMCRNGRYTERGIKGRHGYASERYRIHPEFAVRLVPQLDRVGVLLEPATVVAKAWEHLERIGYRAAWSPKRVLVTGAGPIGLLAALLGVQRGLDVGVLDRVTDGPKPQLATALGAVHDAVPVHGSGGFTSCDDRTLRDQLAGWVDGGIPRVKMKVGRHPQQDASRVRAARRAIGDAELYVDANGAYTRKEALLWAERLAEHDVRRLEEPVSSDDRPTCGWSATAPRRAWTSPRVSTATTCPTSTTCSTRAPSTACRPT